MTVYVVVIDDPQKQLGEDRDQALENIRHLIDDGEGTDNGQPVITVEWFTT